jgi:hypothetical protein
LNLDNKVPEYIIAYTYILFILGIAELVVIGFFAIAAAFVGQRHGYLIQNL